MDPDEYIYFFTADLGSNCLPRLSSDDTSRHPSYSFHSLNATFDCNVVFDLINTHGRDKTVFCTEINYYIE